MRFSSTFSPLWKFLCFCLLCYYGRIETLEYLERAMVTNAELEFDADFSAVAVCYLLPLIIRLTKLSSPIFPNHTERERKAMREHILYRKYTSDFILNHTQSVGGFLVPVHGTYNPNEFLKNGYRCAEYSNNKGSESIVLNVISKVIYIPQSVVNIHAYQRSRKPRRPRLVDDSISRPQHEYLTLQKIIVKRLPAPFATKCRDYDKDSKLLGRDNNGVSEESLEDRDHCFERCISRLHNQTTPKEFVATTGKISSETIGQASYCDTRCRQPDCYEEVFQTLSNSFTTYEVTITGYTVYEMRPVLSLQYAPARLWIQFVVNVAGLVNTLLGFAACDILKIFNPIATIDLFRTYISLLLHRRIFHKTISNVVLLLSMLGFAWQVVNATLNYLRYEASSELYFGRTTNIEIPVYSICFPIISLLKLEYKKTTYSELERNSFRNITVMTYRVEEIFEEIELFFFQTIKTRKLVRKQQFTTHYVDRFKCFQIDLKYKLPSVLPDKLIRGYTNITFKYLKYNVFLGVDRRMPFDLSFDKNVYTLERKNVLYYTYIRTNLLPYPFKTNCNSHPQYTREACLDGCLREDTSLPGVVIAPSSDLTLKDYTDQYFTRRQTCRKKCSILNCNVVLIYSLYAYSLSRPSFHLDKPERETIFSLVPSVPLVEFIMYLTSFLSFWLGVSLVALFGVIPHIRRYLDSRHHANDVTNINTIVKRNRAYISGTRFLIFSSLLAGLLYHLHNIFDLYLLYEMQTSTTITRGGEFRPPALSICYYIEGIVREGLKKPKSWDSTAFLDNTTLSFNEVFDTLKIRNILDDTFSLVHAKDYITYKEDRYYDRNVKCFVIRRLTSGKALPALSIRRAPDSRQRTVFSYSLTTAFASRRSKTMITLHDELDVGRKERRHALKWGDVKFRLHYAETITKMLHYPYATNCYDYTLSGFASRDDCIEECSQNEFLKQLGHISAFITRKSYRHETKSALYLETRKSKNVTKTCRVHCARKDCLARVYETLEIDVFDDKRPWLFSLAEASSVTQSIYEPKLQFFAFAIYVFGILGLWLGLDALTFPSLVKSLLTRSNN